MKLYALALLGIAYAQECADGTTLTAYSDETCETEAFWEGESLYINTTVPCWDVTAAIAELTALAEGERRLQTGGMSTTTVCGNKVKWSLYGSTDCSGGLLANNDETDADFANEAVFEWDTCTQIPGEAALWVKLVAGADQDTTLDVEAYEYVSPDAATGSGAVSTTDDASSGCNTGTSWALYSDATCETPTFNALGESIMPSDPAQGCYTPDMSAMLGDLGDLDLGLDSLDLSGLEDIDLSALEDLNLEDVEGGRRLQDDINLDDLTGDLDAMMGDLDAMMGDLTDQLGDAMGEMMGALSMSIMLRCGDKVVMSMWQSNDCSGEPVEGEQPPNMEWDTCTPVPDYENLYIMWTAGDSVDLEFDAASGAMALKGAMAIAIVLASLF